MGGDEQGAGGEHEVEAHRPAAVRPMLPLIRMGAASRTYASRRTASPSRPGSRTRGTSWVRTAACDEAPRARTSRRADGSGGSVRRRAPPTRRVRDVTRILWTSFSHVSTSDGCVAAAAALSVVHIIFSAQSAPSALMLAAALPSSSARTSPGSLLGASTCLRMTTRAFGMAIGSRSPSCARIPPSAFPLSDTDAGRRARRQVGCITWL